MNIIVESPQFHSTFHYYLYIQDTFHIFPASEMRNDFVEKCLTMFFAFAKVYYTPKYLYQMCSEIAKYGYYLGIKLRAHNDFYSQINILKSQGKPLLSSSLAELSPFLPSPKDPITNKVIVNKTGMGSSAALCTALMASLLQFFDIIHLPDSSITANNNNYDSDENTQLQKDKNILHNLSQLAHAVAQGKLGSGFDISAGVYGTLTVFIYLCMYTLLSLFHIYVLFYIMFSYDIIIIFYFSSVYRRCIIIFTWMLSMSTINYYDC